MTTNSYAILRQAILARQPVTCRYKERVREVCPHVLGTSGNREKVLVWQFAGGSNAAGGWRCLFVEKITLVVIRPGEWRTGSGHRWDQTCVEKVDVDVDKQSGLSSP